MLVAERALCHTSVPQRNRGTLLLKGPHERGPAQGTEVRIPVGFSCPHLTCRHLQRCLGYHTVKVQCGRACSLDILPVPAPESQDPSVPWEPPSDYKYCQPRGVQMPQALLLQDDHKFWGCFVQQERTWLPSIWAQSLICVGRAEPGSAHWLTPPFSWHPPDALQKSSVNAQRGKKLLLRARAQKLPSLVHLIFYFYFLLPFSFVFFPALSGFAHLCL